MAPDAFVMIEASIAKSSQALSARLAAKARKLGLAHGENALRSRRSESSRWRNPRLLWPLFTEEE